MKNVVLFTAHAMHGNVERMRAGLAAGFVRLGLVASTIDVGQPDFAADLRRVTEGGRADFFLGMTGIGLDRRAEDNIFNRIGLPLVSVYLDPLVGYADQVSVPIRRRIVTATADGDVDYWRAAAPQIAVRHLPHAAESAAGGAPGLSWAERDIDILCPVSGCEDPEATRASWVRHGEKVAAELNAILDVAVRAPLRPLMAAIAEVLGGRLEAGNPFAIHPYFVTLDAYLRARARWGLLAALKGLPITVAGPGWEAFAARHPDHGFAFVGPREAGAIRQMMARSRIVLNACTGFHGTHERVFDAQAAGAVAATTPTRWFADNAPRDTLVVLELEAGPAQPAADRLRALLADAKEMRRIAAQGCAWQAGHHTWTHRAQDILKWIRDI